MREREKKSLENARQEGYEEGHRAGYENAFEAFAIYTKCAVCGKTLVAYNTKQKEILSQFMRDEGWCHPECIEKTPPR